MNKTFSSFIGTSNFRDLNLVDISKRRPRSNAATAFESAAFINNNGAVNRGIIIFLEEKQIVGGVKLKNGSTVQLNLNQPRIFFPG